MLQRIEDCPNSGDWPDLDREAVAAYKEAADWEIKTSMQTIKKYSALNKRIESALKVRNYRGALGILKKDKTLADGTRKKVRQDILTLWAAAATVHDDQLLVRIWTCYGFHGGSYWAAASLWRGLGMIGQVIDFHRIWKQEIDDKFGLTEENRYDEDKEEDRKKYEEEITQRITGLLRTHCLRGLVPGMGLGGPSPNDTLDLAFSEWDTEGQRRATRRMAERLRRWLDRIHEQFRSSPFEKSEKWSSCVVRRMHGAHVIGSFWTWLEAEHLNHQGRQYSRRSKYHWNAGLALTSWIRVLIRYFERSHEERAIIETCPLVSPFLSHSARDPFLASLRRAPYHTILREIAIAVQKRSDTSTSDAGDKEAHQPTRHRFADHLSKVTIALEKLWHGAAERGTLKDLEDSLIGDGKTPEEPRFEQEAVRGVLEKVLKRLLPAADGDATSDLTEAKVFEDIEVAIKALHYTASDLRRVLQEEEDKSRKKGSDGDQGRPSLRDSYFQHLLETFRPRLDNDGLPNGASVRYELASLINQHWKVATHASTASLFYQLPRARRPDFGTNEGHE